MKSKVNLSFLVITIYLIIGILGPMLSPYHPESMSADSLMMPSDQHFLGTNNLGQDILSRLFYATRHSLLISTSVAIVSTVLSTLLAALAAMEGGMFDRVIMRITDVFLALPELVVCLLIAAYITPDTWNLIVLLTLFEWPISLKLIRESILTEKENNFVLSARLFGGSNSYVFFKHILGQIIPVLSFLFVRTVIISVFMEASFSYLGLLSPQTISWGTIISRASAFSYLEIWKFWLLPAGLLLSIYVIALTYLSHYFEDIKGV